MQGGYPEALKRLKPCKGKGHSCQLVSSQVRVRVTYFSASLKSWQKKKKQKKNTIFKVIHPISTFPTHVLRQIICIWTDLLADRIGSKQYRCKNNIQKHLTNNKEGYLVNLGVLHHLCFKDLDSNHLYFLLKQSKLPFFLLIWRRLYPFVEGKLKLWGWKALAMWHQLQWKNPEMCHMRASFVILCYSRGKKRRTESVIFR